jgi:hypothetical protein
MKRPTTMRSMDSKIRKEMAVSVSAFSTTHAQCMDVSNMPWN